MASMISKTALAATLSLALAAPAALAQTSTARSPGDGMRMPWQSGFWGHVGASYGRSELDEKCDVGSCDFKDQAWRIYGGGRFNNIAGVEIGYIDYGKFDNGPGDTDGHGIDLALIAGVPFLENWAVFGKLGGVYSRTDVDGPGGGKENGWGARYGLGLQVGLTPNWAIRADLDRYRVKFEGGREDVDTLMIGAQYTFR